MWLFTFHSKIKKTVTKNIWSRKLNLHTLVLSTYLLSFPMHTSIMCRCINKWKRKNLSCKVYESRDNKSPRLFFLLNLFTDTLFHLSMQFFYDWKVLENETCLSIIIVVCAQLGVKMKNLNWFRKGKWVTYCNGSDG